MKLFVKHNIFDDFIEQRANGLATCADAKLAREVTPWDIVGATSDLSHDKRVVKFIQESIGDHEIVNPTRHFNWCTSNPYNSAHIHYDDYDYIVIVYLNLPTQYDPSIDGTGLFRHKISGKRYVDDEVRANDKYYKIFESSGTLEDTIAQEKIIWENDYMNRNNWEMEWFIPMESNKAILFEPRYLHSETRNFGDNFLNSRLIEVLYINKKESK